jgi:hypothetical protein
VAARHPREHGAGQRQVPAHDFAGRHRGEGPRGGHAEGGHGLAHHVLAQHGAKGRASVAAAGERRGPRALELHVVAATVAGHDFAKQNRAAITELRHEAAKLMPGVGEGDGVGALEEPVAREGFHARR